MTSIQSPTGEVEEGERSRNTPAAKPEIAPTSGELSADQQSAKIKNSENPP